jgi:hypothetical protein
VDKVMLSVPPTDVNVAVVGLIVYTHDPDCVTVKVLPAMVSVPVLDVEPAFAEKEKCTVPLPVPLSPEVIVSQALLLCADQAQPLGTATLRLPAPAEELTADPEGCSVAAQSVGAKEADTVQLALIGPVV